MTSFYSLSLEGRDGHLSDVKVIYGLNGLFLSSHVPNCMLAPPPPHSSFSLCELTSGPTLSQSPKAETLENHVFFIKVLVYGQTLAQNDIFGK